MTTSTSGSTRRPLFIAGAALAILLAGGAVWYFAIRTEEKPMPSILTYQEGDLLYSFHVPTGSEELYDLKADPARHENLARPRKADTDRLRQLLTKKLGIEDLEELRNGKVIDALKAHGYM